MGRPAAFPDGYAPRRGYMGRIDTVDRGHHPSHQAERPHENADRVMSAITL